MKTDIILAGVGGQGILSIAAVLGEAALAESLYLKQAEVHGMSQRGGDVQSNLRLSSTPISSDLIPFGKADLIISLEPMEALRYLPWLSNNGTIVTNSVPFVNIDPYPTKENLDDTYKELHKKVVIDAEKIAKDTTGTVRTANMVMLGAASSFIEIDFPKIQNAVRAIFQRKGEEIIEMNLKALEAGRNAAL
ncbi:MAG: indolepyruvate oxidoreductase subunit beta [Bacteroidales bacterium]|nr:indolepyruvate oxidoreductase subunit beta [Bacteroidales bacterium]